MILSTTNDLPGYEVTEVFGITVRSRNIGSQIAYGTAVKIRRTYPSSAASCYSPARVNAMAGGYVMLAGGCNRSGGL
jgi:hypothetical protein